MSKQVHVTLTGGLGNQFFQLSAGLSMIDGVNETVVLDSGLGRPRLSSDGLPELASFSFSEKVLFKKNQRNSWFYRKTNGYLLRMGVRLKWYEKPQILRTFLKKLGRFVLTRYFKEKVDVFTGEGLGYFDLPISDKSVNLSGYFQSYKYFELGSAKEVLSKISLKSSSEELEHLINLCRLERPLIVHFRLGDYEQEELFGIPGDDYYRKALDCAITETQLSNIWFFSDDIEKAKTRFPSTSKLNVPVRWINSVEDSTAKTFELMRHGAAYVLANSSFSYWAALISHTKDAKVWAPWPWFQKMDSPNLLIPPSWETINPWTPTQKQERRIL